MTWPSTSARPSPRRRPGSRPLGEVNGTSKQRHEGRAAKGRGHGHITPRLYNLTAEDDPGRCAAGVICPLPRNHGHDRFAADTPVPGRNSRKHGDMANPQQVEAAVLALKAANGFVVAAMPGGMPRMAPHGTSLLFSGGPMRSLDVVLVTAAEPDLDELTALAGQARELAASAGVPWSIRVRGAVPDPRVEALARGYGL